jgi:threonine dehydrogenase-like Zn-dependent dehydrogenase
MLVELVIKLYNVIQVAVDVDKVSYAKKSSASLDLGASSVGLPEPMGHEFLGVVEEVGAQVSGLKRGDLVVVPFAWADNACDFCREGLQTQRRHAEAGRRLRAQARLAHRRRALRRRVGPVLAENVIHPAQGGSLDHGS